MANRQVDLDVERLFFNPHPGGPFIGAAASLPGPIKQAADQLDGQRLSLREAVARLRAPGIGRIEVVAEYNYIGLWLDGGDSGPTHLFRVIQYR